MWECVSDCFSAQCPGHGSHPEMSLHLLQSQGTEPKPHWPSELGQSMAAPGHATKARACSQCASPGDPGTREHGRGTARKPVPTPGGLCRGLQWTLTCVRFIGSLPFRTPLHDKLVGCFHSRTGCLSLLLLVPREWQPIKNIFSTGCMLWDLPV